MPSERVQRQIDRLLDEAEAAIAIADWDRVRAASEAALALYPESEDAEAYLAAAGRAQGGAPTPAPASVSGASESAPVAPSTEEPSSFANGRYLVRKFLGEGGKKRVFLAHDSLLDRDVAFALIKTEGLDGVGRERILYSLGAMLYEMVTGKPPASPPNPLSHVWERGVPSPARRKANGADVRELVLVGEPQSALAGNNGGIACGPGRNLERCGLALIDREC